MMSSIISANTHQQTVSDEHPPAFIQGCRNQIFTAVMQLPGLKKTKPFTISEENYIKFLCGLTEKEPDSLDLERKARLGRLFEAGLKMKWKFADILIQVDKLPGLAVIYQIRDQVEKEKAKAVKKAVRH